MHIFATKNEEFAAFMVQVENIITAVSEYAKEADINELNKFVTSFKNKTEDFYRENRKLNIGVIGQVKAGKSSFLNTLLFNGQEILPKASTPKTATLTKMEYSEENIIQIEYYTPDEWSVLAENALVDLDDDIYTTAREIQSMVKRNGLTPEPYLQKGTEKIHFDAYEELIANLNDYVGEDGKFTPIVKAVTLYLNKEEFKGLSIVDTPGLNDPIASRTLRTKEFMELCDVVFFLSQSGSFLDKSDWTLLSSQLPQKGVKKLILIASKYDSGIRDILRVQDEDDVFGEDENTADTIPKACKIIKKKLKNRAKVKVDEFVKDLEQRESSQELRDVIKQCANPIMISALARNMSTKSYEDYSSEEKNIYNALKMFSQDMEADLALLGNFQEVYDLFDEVVREKEAILEGKSKSFIPNGVEEVRNILTNYLEKTLKRAQVLENNDRDQLLGQKKLIESQMDAIKSDISIVFGELIARLESEKAAGIREIRDVSKDYLSIQDRTGTRTVCKSRTVSDSKWYKPWTWGSSHTEYYTYEQSYSYCIAADGIDNLRKFGIEASNQVEEVFSETLQVKELKRKLLDVVINNFDMGSEKYDPALFRIMVEETVSKIEFPIFKLDISDAIDGIAGKFTGEITSASEKNALTTALSAAIQRIYDALCNDLEREVKNFKTELSSIAKEVENSLLTNITTEFEALLEECNNKDKEIASYKAYAVVLEKEIAKL